MNNIFYMAWQYIRFHWFKTSVLIASISLIFILPLGLQVIINQGSEMLTRRAESTPLLIGTRGSALDLTLSALYYKTPTLNPIKFNEVEQINNTNLALAIPMQMRYKAVGYPIIGTSLEYLDFQNLETAQGRSFAMLGECVLGSEVAKSQNLKVGDHIVSTPAGAFDVAGSYPLKMKIVGILKQTGRIEDQVIFVDIKTTWVISGLAHGHDDVTTKEASDKLLERDGDQFVASAAVLSYTEITEININSFHFHGNSDEFPVDAIIVIPNDRKSGIMLRGRFTDQTNLTQIVVPVDIINDLLTTVFSVRNYIIAGSIGVGLATLVIAILVFTLSIRLRQREINTIRKIGGTRARLHSILATEIILVLSSSIGIAILITWILSRYGLEIVRAII